PHGSGTGERVVRTSLTALLSAGRVGGVFQDDHSLEKSWLQLFLDEGFAQAFDAGPTAFDNVFVHQRVIGDGIAAVVAGHAKGIGGQAGGFHHALLRKIRKRVGAEVFADLIERIVGRHQFAAVGEIDAIDTGINVWRATEQY